MRTSYNAAGAKDYFTESLDRGDYYANGQEMPGRWGGKIKDMLALGAEVSKQDFFDLCDNVNPRTGENLTPRTKDGRRVGYDINFHVPKSVSLLYALAKDGRILDAFQESVALTMRDIEAAMETRVRVSGEQGNRLTGNALWATFIHTTARPVAGFPDPLLHAHCFTFNVTKDDTEGRFKAGEFGSIKKSMPLFESRFHLRMSERMRELGYDVERSGKFWEVKGISRDLIDRFSRRSKEIDALAEQLGINDAPERKAELAAKTRQRKDKAASPESLDEQWREHAATDGVAELEEAKERSHERVEQHKRVLEDLFRPGPEKEDAERQHGGERADERERQREGKRDHESGQQSESSPPRMPTAKELKAAREFVNFTIAHEFERKSAIRVLELEASLTRKAIGKVSEAALVLALSDAKLIRRTFRGEQWATPQYVFDEEQRMLAFERETRGSFNPIVGTGHVIRDRLLNEQQKAAVRHVLESYDQVMLIRGAAGVGKTTLMREAISAMRSAGERVTVLSPLSTVAESTLPEEGFKDAATLARLLIDTEMQKEMRGGVLWVDEAGLIGTRQMCQLFDLAKKQKARIVLSGDELQHSPVARGDGVRLLVDEGGMRSAEVREVVRQKGEYKEACEHLNRGDVVAGFEKLDALGFIKEIGGPDSVDAAHVALAEEYGEALKAGKKVTAVAPTKNEGERVNAAVRAKLKELNVVKDKDRELMRLKALNLSVAQKMRADSYSKGQVIEFHDATRGRKNGQRSEVVKIVGDTVWISGPLGSKVPLLLKLSDAAKFSVFEKETIDIARGDTIRITSNGKTKADLLGFLPDRRRPLKGGAQLLREIGSNLGVVEPKRLRDNPRRINNGSEYKVIGFVPVSGDIILSNGRILDKHFGHITHAYCTTSQASQSKTVHRVLVAMTSLSYGLAMNATQFYVSVTRASERCSVFTENKSTLLQEVSKNNDRIGASTIVREGTQEHMDNAHRYQEHMNRGRETEKDMGRDYDR